MSRMRTEARVKGTVPHFGGDLQGRRLTAAFEAQARRHNLGGIMVDRSMSMVEIMSLQGVGGTALEPLLVHLAPGTWDFFAAGFDITRSNIILRSAVPRQAIFRRTVTPTAPLLKLSGTDNRLIDIEFDDDVGSQPAVQLSGARSHVEGCWFEDCYRAVHVTAGNGQQITGNVVQTSTDTSYAIYLAGGDQHVVHRNTGDTSAPGTFIRADDGVDDCSFVGNVSAGVSTYVVDYQTLDNAAAGNAPASGVNAR